eukprot:g1073.t1
MRILSQRNTTPKLNYRSSVTLVKPTLFFLPHKNLDQVLGSRLRPGTRLVTYAFPVENWTPERVVETAPHMKNEGKRSNLYLYIVPVGPEHTQVQEQRQGQVGAGREARSGADEGAGAKADTSGSNERTSAAQASQQNGTKMDSTEADMVVGKRLAAAAAAAEVSKPQQAAAAVIDRDAGSGGTGNNALAIGLVVAVLVIGVGFFLRSKRS